MIITSEKGLDPVMQENLSPQEAKNYTKSRMKFGCWWFKPVQNDKGEVTATEMFVALNCDAGGNIPLWIQNVTAPQVAVQANYDFCTALRLQKGQTQIDRFYGIEQEKDLSKIEEFNNIYEQVKILMQTKKSSIPKKIRYELYALY